LLGHSAAAVQPGFGPEGKTLYTASHDGTAIAWDPSGKRGLGRPFEFTQDSQFRGLGSANSEYLHPGVFVADGRLIAVGLKKEGIRFFDARRLAPDGAPLLGTGGEVRALALSPDGRTLAAGSWNGKVTLWDVASRSLRHGPFNVSSDYVQGMSFSADGTMLAIAAASEGVKLWDVATAEPRGRIADGSEVGAVAFSPSEPFLADVLFGYLDHPERAGDVEIWDATQRRLIREIDLDAGPGDLFGNAIAFAPHGRVVASSGVGDPFVHLWDVQSGELVRELEQNVGGVLMLEFSPDGSLLAASGYGGPFVALLDVASGEKIGPRLTATAGGDRVMVDFSPDGRHLLQTHSNGTGAVWDVDPASWARRACDLANRTLTHEEWEKFLPGRPYEPACQ